jgi:hypothetical protein
MNKLLYLFMQDSQSFAMGLFSGEARTDEVFPYPEGKSVVGKSRCFKLKINTSKLLTLRGRRPNAMTQTRTDTQWHYILHHND